MSFTTILALLSLSTLLPTPTASQATLPPRVINPSEQPCPSDAVRETIQSQINQDIRALLQENVICPAVRTQTCPAAQSQTCSAAQTQTSPADSCSAISTNCPSGNYWVRSSTGSAVQVYCDTDRVCDCDMDRLCGCNSTGWARVAYLNITDTSQQCPSAWRLLTTPRRCARTTADSCDSAMFSSNGIRYSHVCGRVIGYQYGHPDGDFRVVDQTMIQSIDSNYLDGVSITHGASGSRQHIWSFSGAVFPGRCPFLINASAPSFVGEDYFCETGNDDMAPWGNAFFPDDPLWDGQNCGTSTASECTFNNPPWFCKQLPQTTTDDIEVRICSDELLTEEDTPVQLIELYIR